MKVIYIGRFCYAYMDDIIVYSKSLKGLMQKNSQSKLVFREEVEFLKYKEWYIHPNKTKTI